MDRYVSPVIYRASVTSVSGATAPSHFLQTAREAGFKEDWLQAAIAADPELVISACTEAELTDESWYLWSRNVSVGTGTIDVLLISESGRVGIVETKLSYNPENRRTVLAQVLDYAVALPELEVTDLPPVPDADGVPLVDVETLHDRVQEGDYLLMIAGERLHSRVIQLSRSLLGRHLVRGWDLALVEVAVYGRKDPQGAQECLLVPHLRGVVIPERRQVVKVIVSGDRARIEVEEASPVQVESTGHSWSEATAFAEFERPNVPDVFRRAAATLRDLRRKYPGVTIERGRGQFAKLILKRNGKGLLELKATGNFAFRPYKFPEALGTDLAAAYQHDLNELLGNQVQGTHPNFELDQRGRDSVLPQVLALLEGYLARAST